MRNGIFNPGRTKPGTYAIKNSKITVVLNNDDVAGYIFILPWLAGFFAFTLIPILSSIYLSFTEYDLLSAPVFVGLDNFRKVFFSDPQFWKALQVTFFFVFLSVPLRLVFALLVAMMLNNNSKAVPFYRTVYYLPSIMGGSVAVAVLWRRLFDTNGVINAILQQFSIDSKISWLGNPKTAIWTLIILAAWQFGSSMLIFLAGLKQIPVTYYEAATVDGANALQKFFKITIPMLTPVIFFNLVMQLINGFMAFTQAFIITEGGPLDSTLFYALYLYRRGFEFYQMGYGSALAWILLLIVAFFTAIAFKSSNTWVYYESKENG
jgi:multiple sugar transport system permease protein